MTRLFVYGSLKRGCSNAALMVGAGFGRGATFEGPFRTAEGFALHRVGAYPALVPAPGGRVRGEVYRVGREHLARLDEFEACPDLYRREEIALEDGSRAEAYLMDPARVEGHPLIGEGVWIEQGAKG